MALFHHSLKNLTVHEVVTILEKMDRHDIIDDTQSLLGKYFTTFAWLLICYNLKFWHPLQKEIWMYRMNAVIQV